MIQLRSFILASAALFLAACSSAPEAGRYKIALVPDRAGQHGLFVMNSDRTGGRLLTPESTAQLRSSSWSPDGKKIAFFATRTEDAPLLQKYRMPLHFPLYLMNASGGTPKRLLEFPVSDFAWSPDSRQLLYVSAYEDPAHNDPDIVKGTKEPMSAVYLLNIETGEQRRVTGFGQHCTGSWSPDGTQLALSFGDAQNSSIYIASVDGKHTRVVADSPGINMKPVWSPDGKRIAYVCFSLQDTGLKQDVFIVQTDGTNRRQIRAVNPYEASWSVDGRSLLLQSIDGIILASADGNTMLDYRNRAVRPQDSVFTPDGKQVMFRSNHEGPWNIYAVDMNGAHIRRMTGDLSSSTFCLSPIQH